MYLAVSNYLTPIGVVGSLILAIITFVVGQVRTRKTQAVKADKSAVTLTSEMFVALNRALEIRVERSEAEQKKTAEELAACRTRDAEKQHVIDKQTDQIADLYRRLGIQEGKTQ